MTQDRPVIDAPVRTRREPLRAWRIRPGDERSALPAAARAALGPGLDVEVPRSVLAALVDAGLAPDVTVDGREEDVEWASACSWVYAARVERHGTGEQVRLVLEGVDTLATVRVDGTAVLTCDDMFHRWVVDLGVDDAPGAWDVEVELAPVMPVARAAEAANPLPRADVYELPYNQVRKMACSFGWDWGPVTVTSGLWRAAVVERAGAVHLDRVLVSGGWDEGDGGQGTALLRLDVTTSPAVTAVEVSVRPWAREAEDGHPLWRRRFDVADAPLDRTVEVPGAARWDVVGRGEQALYVVEVRAVDAAGTPGDTVTRRVGFRRVDVDQSGDGTGHRFALCVNGSRVWARGFNWIPAHVLPETVTREHVRALVGEAVATGANLLRVWGGGTVESDDFYDVCDELGVLVWQDFSFACAAYPEDEATLARVRAEAADAVERVGHRPALALWCGNNENLWGHEDWGWAEVLDGRPWGERIYREVLPAVLSVLDPDRPYVPGSPFSPDPLRHPNDPALGTTHHWDTWNDVDYTAFEAKRSPFASEFGWQAPASWPTLVRALGGAPAGGGDPRLPRLQKAFDGMAKLDRGVADHVPHLVAPAGDGGGDGRGWDLATQLVQARARRTSVGRFRSLHDTCSGALWWQLDDCWPALSWSVLDVTGARKLAWWAAAEVLADRAVLPTADGAADGLTLVNDTPRPWAGECVVRVVTEEGTVLAHDARGVEVPADGHLVVRPGGAVPPGAGSGAAAVVVDLDGRRGTRWLLEDRALAHPAARVRLTVERPGPGEAVLVVEALDLVRDVVVLAETHPELPDARVDRQLALLLPGERLRVTVTAAAAASVPDEAWASLLAAGTALDVAAG